MFKKKNYPIIACLFCSCRHHRLAKYARIISPNGFVVGSKIYKPHKFNFIKNYQLKKFDLFTFREDEDSGNLHVTDICAKIFDQFFGIKLSHKEKKPFLTIPKEWFKITKTQLKNQGIDLKNKTIFINSFAKSKRRCWPIKNITQLLNILQQDKSFSNVNFLINSLPHNQIKFKKLQLLKNVFLFTADKNFFQLPATISHCNLVISVDTSVIHLASTFNIPLVVLMRQKNINWTPKSNNLHMIYTKTRHQNIKSIKVEDVIIAIKSAFKQLI